MTSSNHDLTTLRRLCKSVQIRKGTRININAIGRISRKASSNKSVKSNPPRHDPAQTRIVLSTSRHEGPEELEEAMTTFRKSLTCIGRWSKRSSQRSATSPDIMKRLQEDFIACRRRTLGVLGLDRVHPKRSLRIFLRTPLQELTGEARPELLGNLLMGPCNRVGL